MAPVIQALRQHRARYVTRICVTAQHREMLDQVLSLFHIRTHHDLNVMRPGQSLEDVTARVLQGMKGVLAAEKPDMMLVQGDTTTVMAAALAAFYADVPIGHVEAGLRTWEKRSPFPEEINRVIASHLADLHFAPTIQARKNLLREGIDPSTVVVTGNTVIDALFHVRKTVRRNRRRFEREFRGIDFHRRMILVTGHRRENFGEGFENICHAIRRDRLPGAPESQRAATCTRDPWNPPECPLAGSTTVSPLRLFDGSEHNHSDGFGRCAGGSALAGKTCPCDARLHGTS
jgi:UDP-N-acetylglucosamine 2-epimerase (non-hydrolysing)